MSLWTRPLRRVKELTTVAMQLPKQITAGEFMGVVIVGGYIIFTLAGVVTDYIRPEGVSQGLRDLHGNYSWVVAAICTGAAVRGMMGGGMFGYGMGGFGMGGFGYGGPAGTYPGASGSTPGAGADPFGTMKDDLQPVPDLENASEGILRSVASLGHVSDLQTVLEDPTATAGTGPEGEIDKHG